MKKNLLPVFFLGTLIMIFAMNKTGAILKTSATPAGILNLEFANTIEKVNTIVLAWQPQDNINRMQSAINNTLLDFVFIFFYSIFLFLASKKITGSIPKFERAGNMVAAGALISGVLDIIENTGMLLSLTGNQSNPVAFMTAMFSYAKWLLVAIAVMYIFSGILLLMVRKIKKEPA